MSATLRHSTLALASRAREPDGPIRQVGDELLGVLERESHAAGALGLRGSNDFVDAILVQQRA
jgi:hypothetical protein